MDQERLAVALKRVTKDSQRRVTWLEFSGKSGLSVCDHLGYSDLESHGQLKNLSCFKTYMKTHKHLVIGNQTWFQLETSACLEND